MANTEIHPKALWARRVVRQKLAAELNALMPEGMFTPDNLPPDEERLNYTKGNLTGPGAGMPVRKVCIVGAGVAGLYIAMILDSLEIPGLSYDILESNDRVGGRMYTHKFSDEPHDYYDIGAMRYPCIKIMDRTFDLFERMELPLINYYLDSDLTPSLFNDRFKSDEKDPYNVGVSKGGQVPDEVVDSVSKLLGDAFNPYKDLLKADFKNGMEELTKVDELSTREFLRCGGPDGKGPRYDFFSIQWMETMNTSTNLFDEAFAESVLDSFDFDYPQLDDQGNPKEVEWKCIEGGTSKLAEAMKAKLKRKIETNKRVVAISMDQTEDVDGNLTVQCANEEAPRTGYSTVFSTTTLGCLGRMDLRGLELHPSQKDAIRALHYDDSVKVALKFKYPWWITRCGITQGGVASTDLPLRTCVYPSYNLHDGADKPAVLLASYTWAQDANRMSSLVAGGKPTDDELVELILRNLARLHAQHEGVTYELIRAAYTGTFHAYSWSDDPNTAGAFALFAPGQFKNLYPYLTRSAAQGKFHMVGEAASAHHAWIVGALNSAYMAVWKFLRRYSMWEYMDRLEELWGTVDEMEPEEDGTAHLQVIMGLGKEAQVKV